MGVSPAIVEFDIRPSSDLEDIFLHFESRFKALKGLRSVVEISITDADLAGLTRWFQNPDRWEPVSYWCEDTLRLEAAEGASRQEMFGALFLILSASSCREHASDDAVWPHIAKLLKNSASYPILFVAAQPTAACKKIIAAGVRRLGLRNLIDRHGKQEYFDTLKLQFGFTHNGAVRRLDDWLDGFAPLPVRILTGEIPEYSDLKSESFINLWATLKKFRQRKRAEEYTRLALENCPWIRPEWIDDLLHSATRDRVSTASAGPSANILQSTDEQLDEGLCQPVLYWPDDSSPQLGLRINEDQVSAILGEANTAEFQLDGRTVGRWTRQENGNWRGERELFELKSDKKPSLRPKLLSIRERDKIIEEIELKVFGLQEPLVIFDLVNGLLIDEAKKLDPNRGYALLCNADITCPAADGTVKTKEGDYIYKIKRLWSEDLKVVCNDAIYWKPRVSDKQALPPINLLIRFLEDTIVAVNSSSTLVVENIPDDAISASLILAGANHYRLVRHNQEWRTSIVAKITLGLAVGDEQVRVRFDGTNYVRTVTPKLRLRLKGIARRDPADDGQMEWHIVNLNHPLERWDGVGHARFFSGLSEPQLFEGFYNLGKVDIRGLAMRDLHGWGAPLIAGGDRLVVAVEDHGLFRFIPNLFGRQTGQRVVWRSPTALRAEHRIVWWDDLRNEPKVLHVDEVVSEREGSVWRFPQLGAAIAIAVAYEGVRLGSWFHSDRALKALETDASAQLFATLRWLKIPVLNDAWSSAIRNAVVKNPVEFVRGWLGKDVLSSRLCHRDAEDGVEVVIREFLWYFSDRSRQRLEALNRALPSSIEGERDDEVLAFKFALTRLADMCPSLAYNLARARKNYQFANHIRAVAVDLISHPQVTEISQLCRIAIHKCMSLLDATQSEVESAIDAYVNRLEDKALPTRGQHFHLRRLGETVSGRRYIASALLFHLLKGPQS